MSSRNNIQCKNTFFEMFQSTVLKYPERLALCCEDKKLTYRELDKLSSKVASFIIKMELSPETFIGIFQHRTVNYVVTLLGIMKSGNAYVPLDPDTLNPGGELFPMERLNYMLADTESPFIITDEELKPYLSNIGCDIYTVERILETESKDSNAIEVEISESSAAYGIYTSGSSGKPKLTIIEYHSITNLFHGLDEEIFYLFDQSANQMQVSINAPFGFDASVQQLVGLLNGYCLHIVPEDCRHTISKLVRFIEEKRINIFDCTPSQMKLLYRQDMFSKCTSLQAVLVGGEAISEDLWECLSKVENTAVYNMYGPTECCVDATIAKVNCSDLGYPNIGKPISGNRIVIVDEELNEVADGEEGEIIIGGEGVAREYHRRPELNKKVFINCKQGEDDEDIRFYRTGDMGKKLSDGNYLFLGRKDDQVKIRSHRIELLEISYVITNFSHVDDCIVMVHNDNGYDEMVAYIVWDEEKIDKELQNQLVSYLKTMLPTYMLPTYYISLDKIPLTANGKVDKKSLPKPKVNNTLRNGEESILEAAVGDIVENIISTRLSRNDSFMEVGGDSLRVMTLLAEIFLQFGVEIDYKEFFKSPTIAFLVNKIESDQKE